MKAEFLKKIDDLIDQQKISFSEYLKANQGVVFSSIINYSGKQIDNPIVQDMVDNYHSSLAMISRLKIQAEQDLKDIK